MASMMTIVGDGQQQDGVEHRGEDLQPQVAERPALGRGSGGEPDRPEREADPDDIGQDVAGVGEQGQAVRDDGTDEFEDEHGGRDDEHHDQAIAV